MDKSKWGYKKLGEVATFLNGYAFKPSEWNSEGLPIIRIQNLTNTNAEYNYFNGDNIDKRYIVNNGDLLVSWSATLGAFIWDGDKAILNQHIFKTIFDKTDIDKHFLRYSIISSLNLMSTKAHGITMRHITKKDFDNIKIRVPPLSDQHHIVSELDQLSDIISLKQQQMKEYDALAQSLFYEMFGDMDGSEKSFEKKIFGECFKLKSGDSLTAKNIVKGPYAVFGGNGIVGYHSEYNAEGQQIIIGRVGALCGNVHLIDGKNFITDNAFILSDSIGFDKVYLLYFLSMLNLRDYAREAMQPVISNKTLKGITIPLPPLSLQRSFAEKVKAIEHQKSLLKQSIAKTQTLLDSRMQEYFG